MKTIASPAWFQDYVLAVGALTPGSRARRVQLARAVGRSGGARREDHLTQPQRPRPDQRLQGDKGLTPINGTSFATPFVSGVVALVRARFPWMSAGEVMERIKRTARTPEAGPNLATGYGIVDPVAALTYQLPPADQLPDPQTGRPIDGPPAPIRPA